MRRPLLRLEKTDDYEAVKKLFIESDLEFSEEEPVPTDLVQCWAVTHGCERYMCGAVALAKREEEFIIDGIAVDKVYRGMGIGRIMMNKASEKVKELGGTRIFLNARQPGFYYALGFREADPAEAPLFYECATCPQYNKTCHPKIMVTEV